MNNLGTNSTERPLLVLRDIHAAYVKKEILRGVSFALNRGEIVALLGGNGSGKSTALKTIMGLLQPTRGQVLFDDSDITAEPVHHRQQRGIGYLMQGGRVFPNLTVAENLAIAARRADRREIQTRTGVGSIFPVLAERADVRAGLLSGGQKQMLAIEMTMSQRPCLLLLDEPTGGIAPVLAQQIMEQVVKNVRDNESSALIVEQNVAIVQECCNRSLRLKDGQIEFSNVPTK